MVARNQSFLDSVSVWSADRPLPGPFFRKMFIWPSAGLQVSFDCSSRETNCYTSLDKFFYRIFESEGSDPRGQINDTPTDDIYGWPWLAHVKSSTKFTVEVKLRSGDSFTLASEEEKAFHQNHLDLFLDFGTRLARLTKHHFNCPISIMMKNTKLNQAVWTLFQIRHLCFSNKQI